MTLLLVLLLLVAFGALYWELHEAINGMWQRPDEDRWSQYRR